MLRALHDGPPFPATFDGFTIAAEHLDAIIGAAAATRRHSTPTPPPRRSGSRRCCAARPRLVPCHNDLLPGNVLRDGDRLMLVDWEYAGMNDRFFDLANLAVNNGLTRDEEARLLEAYFGEPPTDRHRAELSLMRIMQRLPRGDVGGVQAVVGEIEFDYDAYADQHFARLLAAADRPALRGGPACRGRVMSPTARAWSSSAAASAGRRSPTTWRSSASATSCSSTATS